MGYSQATFLTMFQIHFSFCHVHRVILDISGCKSNRVYAALPQRKI